MKKYLTGAAFIAGAMMAGALFAGTASALSHDCPAI